MPFLTNSTFDLRKWNRFRETIKTYPRDETGNCALVYTDLFVVVAEITTKSSIYLFYKKFIKSIDIDI